MKESEFEKINIKYHNSGKIMSNKDFTCFGYFKVDAPGVYKFITKKNGSMTLEIITKEFLTNKKKKVDEIPAIDCKAVSQDDDFDIHQEDGPVIMWGGE